MVIREQLLRQSLVAREHQSAWMAAGVRHLHQLEKADHVMVEVLAAEELFEEIENDVGLPLLDHRADRPELIRHAERPRFMTELAQRGHHVVFGLELVQLLFGKAGHIVRRNHGWVHQNDDAQLPPFHKANQFLRL
jgi:hypothetical protein